MQIWPQHSPAYSFSRSACPAPSHLASKTISAWLRRTFSAWATANPQALMLGHVCYLLPDLSTQCSLYFQDPSPILHPTLFIQETEPAFWSLPGNQFLWEGFSEYPPLFPPVSSPMMGSLLLLQHSSHWLKIVYFLVLFPNNELLEGRGSTLYTATLPTYSTVSATQLIQSLIDQMKIKIYKLTGIWKQYLWDSGEKRNKWQFRKTEKLLFE